MSDSLVLFPDLHGYPPWATTFPCDFGVQADLIQQPNFMGCYTPIVYNDSTNKIFDQDGKSGYCLLLDDIATFPRDSLLSYSMGVDCFGWNE